MRHFTAVFLALTVAFYASYPVAPAYAYQEAASDIPLVVIRYNQKRVYYDRQLFNAASKALDIKPSARFSLVSFVPQYGSSRAKDKLHASAVQQTNKLIADFKEMGVPKDRINVSRELVDDTRHHEVYIYVD